MEDIDPCIDQGCQKPAEFLRRRRQLCIVILQLPLRETKDDRKVRADLAPARGNDLRRKARAAYKIATITVGPAIGAVPEELVNQIAVGAMKLDAVKSKVLGVPPLST
jgi:hypothetical protein